MYKTDCNLSEFSYLNIENLSEKTVILRSCLNVAVDENGFVTDKTRILESLPAIKYFAEKAEKTIILGHLGRPEGYSKELSFWNVVEVINKESALGVELVPFGQELHQQGKVLLIDNIRFFEGEESKDATSRENFAKELASLGDVFVNDAFADYRESASTFDIAKFSPSFLGPLFLKEVEALSKLNNPKKPFVAVLGGAKLSEKLDALKSLCEVADKVIVGGAMAYTLMKASGVEIGKSLYEEDKIGLSKEILEKYGEKILLPIDHILSSKFEKESASEIWDKKDIPQDKIAIDIGPKTIELYKSEIAKAFTVLWNGPMGVFEWPQSELGTREIGQSIVNNLSAYKIAGGGDSIAAINKFGLNGFDHVSTGGGAMLAFIAYEEFPTLDEII